jgi:hypothetical protein
VEPPAAVPRRGFWPLGTVADTTHEERQRRRGELTGQRRGRVRRPASEALGWHGSAVTCAGNGWHEMAAGTVKDDGAARLPGGGAKRGRGGDLHGEWMV